MTPGRCLAFPLKNTGLSWSVLLCTAFEESENCMQTEPAARYLIAPECADRGAVLRSFVAFCWFLLVRQAKSGESCHLKGGVPCNYPVHTVANRAACQATVASEPRKANCMSRNASEPDSAS